MEAVEGGAPMRARKDWAIWSRVGGAFAFGVLRGSRINIYHGKGIKPCAKSETGRHK